MFREEGLESHRCSYGRQTVEVVKSTRKRTDHKVSGTVRPSLQVPNERDRKLCQTLSVS